MAPNALGAAGSRAAGRARVGDERQDDHDPAARGCRRRRPEAGGQQRHRRQPHVGHRADRSPRPGRPAWRCSRSTSESCPEWSTRSARSCSCSATSAGTSSTDTARSTPSATCGGTSAETHPDLRVVANASDPHVVWAATPAKTTWVDARAGLAERRRHLPELRRAAQLEHGPVRLPVVRLRAAGDAEPARRRHARARRTRVAAPARAAGPLEPRERRAGRDRGHDALRRRSPRGRRRRDDHHDGRGSVHDRRAPRRPARARAARQEPGRMVGGAAPLSVRAGAATARS